MHSALYKGWVRHRRTKPVAHHFHYPLFMLMLDLDELDRVFAGRWFWSTRKPALARFKRSDYLGPAEQPLKQAVIEHVEQSLGRRPAGPVRLLTHLRYFGYIFNPVSFYFCYMPYGESLDAIVAEITNTPWRERHAYVLDCGNQPATGPLQFGFDKAFHISPFMPMQQHYKWRFRPRHEHSIIHMENHDANGHLFDATLSLRRHEITGRSLARVLIEYPCMTAQVISGIHWQALKLWLKGIPVHTHPKKRTVKLSDTTADHHCEH